MNAVANRLSANPDVKTVTFISKEQALKEMTKRFPALVQNLPSNPLPDSLEVVPKHGEQTAAIANSLSAEAAGGRQREVREEDGAPDPQRRAR